MHDEMFFDIKNLSFQTYNHEKPDAN